MSERKLFDRELETPALTDKIAFGTAGTLAKNMTFAALKTFIQSDIIIKSKVFEIGAWNMDANTSPSNVVITIPRIKIRGIKVMIQSDTGALSDLLSVQNGTASTVPQIQIGEIGYYPLITIVMLTRRLNSFFDSPSYHNITNPDTTPYNRGWIVVDYIE
jgi:hypothetical protein